MTTLLNPSAKGGRVRVASGTLTYDTQAADSYSFDNALKLPVGATVVGGLISTSVTTDTATVALGIAGSTAKYKAAAAVTGTASAFLAVPHAAVLAAPLTVETEVIVTTAVAALPAAGSLKVVLFYVVD